VNAMAAGLVARRKIIGVMGSGAREFADLAEPAGRVIARGGYHLLTGGGDGVMTATARAFVAVADRRGLSLGIVRADGVEHLGEHTRRRRYRPRGPNGYVEVPILTHLPYSGSQGKHDLSRNHINVLTASLVVVLPGGAGTATELELALEYGRPVVLFLGAESIAGANAQALTRRYAGQMAVAEGEHDLAHRLYTTAGDPCAA
jgi:predicted Rossmann-fold nucleotide-binding protein